MLSVAFHSAPIFTDYCDGADTSESFVPSAEHARQHLKSLQAQLAEREALIQQAQGQLDVAKKENAALKVWSKISQILQSRLKAIYFYPSQTETLCNVLGKLPSSLIVGKSLCWWIRQMQILHGNGCN